MLPGLAALYGLRWEHIEHMPRRELNGYLDALSRAVDTDHEGVT